MGEKEQVLFFLYEARMAHNEIHKQLFSFTSIVCLISTSCTQELNHSAQQIFCIAIKRDHDQFRFMSLCAVFPEKSNKPEILTIRRAT